MIGREELTIKRNDLIISKMQNQHIAGKWIGGTNSKRK